MNGSWKNRMIVMGIGLICCIPLGLLYLWYKFVSMPLMP
ncbi:hypothetical protein CM49_01432 [Paenibacillus sp. P1XP2]|nr:hypothetical protein CM49_01432 [Paenibacillus sp. P1XP2]